MIQTFMGCCCRSTEDEEEDITLRFRGLSVNYDGRKFLPNVIKTRTYNWISFPFAVLLLQFKPFFSQFFTIIALLQIFRPLQVGLAFTYYLPLVFIFLVSIGRELYTELGCYKRDKVANSMLYQILSDDGIKTVRSDELQVGDIIYLTPGQNIPADILILHGTEPLYLKTTNLDGETDYKSRNACFDTADIYDAEYTKVLQRQLDSHILQYEPPSSQLYKFTGKFVLLSVPKDASSPIMPISLANTAWMNCTLAKGSVTGLVIYTGKQVRIMLGRKKPKSKSGKIDIDINLYVKGLFLLCVFLAFVLTMAGSVHTFVTLIRWIIILNAIIPLAMKVSLEYGKFTMAGTISYDPDIPGIKVQNSNLVEELGLINHIFSDKTGTLTKNDMWLHEIAGTNETPTDEYRKTMLHALMTCHNVELVTERCRSIKITVKSDIVQPSNQTIEEFPPDQPIYQEADNYTAVEKENINNGLTDNVAPYFTNRITDEYLLLNNYIGASPDEVAIIRGMHARGYILKEKTHNRVRYGSTAEEYEFELIHVFPFTSEAKRMSVIVRDIETQVTYLFVKGADTAIEVISKPCHWMRNIVDQLATTGRRTLAYAYKVLSKEDLDIFQRAWISAAEDINSRQEKLDQVEEGLLVNLDVVCVTGIEDQLQENVRETIQSLKRAGIKFWMLTGDKVITSLSIAQACGILPNDVLSKHTDFRTNISKIESTVSQGAESTSQSIYTLNSHIPERSAPSSAIQLTNVTPSLVNASPLDSVPVTTAYTNGRERSSLSPRNNMKFVSYHRPSKTLLRNPFKKNVLRNKKLANIRESAYVRKSQGVFFLTEELSLDLLLQTLHEMLEVVKTQRNIAIIIDGGAIDTLLGTYPTNYFYRHRIHPITGALLPLPFIIKGWRYFVRFIYVYFTGRVKSGKGSLGPDAKIRELFAKVTCSAETVICCRCTPGQKALLAEIITTYSGKQSLGVGDGANDVPLIQLCAVGVGIAGKEGTQAANSADFVLNEFQGLKKLLLWHGRNSYIGSAQMCQFIMQRGITQTLIQIWFSMLYYFVTLVIYTGVLLLGFSTFFTMIPPFNYYINEDVDYKLVMQYPEIYRYTSSGRLISFKTFCLWLLASIVISFMIFMSVTRVLPGDVIYTEFILLSFAALLLNQLLLVSFTTHRWSVLLVIALVGSYASFYLVQTIYPDIFPLSFFYSFSFTWKSLYIAFSAALPTYIGSLLMKHLGTPPVIKKLRKLRDPADCACCNKRGRCVCTNSPIHYYSSTGTYYFNLTDNASNVLTCRYCSKCCCKC
ncbi:Phospholipid-translocating P-type ATPase (flippase) [Giardia duodenalis]|uniref:Phospholipid-translocating P-type ATPase (Flippase) n=1 Tax=Giardia intestinalis TaxID=5741 RepID=V6U1H4_GIAIN|nr:Phospholipid-translocating P-type ATPase (flippase) [Giardia intestinalis]